MLDKHEISVGCLTTYVGFILGLALLTVGQFSSAAAGRWGIAVLCLACTYSVHRSLASLCARMRDSFEMGREYERTRGLTSLH